MGDCRYIKVSAQQKARATIVTFPGGTIGIGRTSDGSHWAHIAVGEKYDENEGVIVDSRIDSIDGVGDLFGPRKAKRVNYIALRIKAKQ